MAIESDLRADAFLRFWNADGSEVKACGNGTRAVAHLLLEELKKDEVRIQTEADLLKGARAENGLVSVDMGSPLMGWEDIPLSEKMDVRGVDVKIGPMDDPYLYKPAVVSMGLSLWVWMVIPLIALDAMLGRGALKRLKSVKLLRRPTLYWGSLGVLSGILLALYPLEATPFVYFQF